MKRNTFSILYFIKRAKLLKNGEAPVYMRITVNGSSTETSLKRSIHPKLWDTTRNKAKGNSQSSVDLNDYLSSVKYKVHEQQKILMESGGEITVKNLRRTFLGTEEKHWTIVKLFQEHNSNMELLVGKEYSPSTLQRYNAALKHIGVFCKSKYAKDDLPLCEIDHYYITSFELYLKSIAGCRHNSAMKHVKALKKIIRIALANDYIKRDPFFNYSISIKHVDRECLTDEEIKRIRERKFSIQRLEIIRDLFVFQCYTGLAYVDLSRLSKEHLQIGVDGYTWIILNRQKTGITCRIPLFDIAKDIIDKYSMHAQVEVSKKLLPVPSNQKMNAYLKEIADLCDIKKKLHTHLARHTFATTVALSNGIPIETISKMVGHTKIPTTQLYARVLDTKISADVADLRVKMNGK